MYTKFENPRLKITQVIAGHRSVDGWTDRQTDRQCDSYRAHALSMRVPNKTCCWCFLFVLSSSSWRIVLSRSKSLIVCLASLWFVFFFITLFIYSRIVLFYKIFYHHVAVNFPAYIQVPVKFTRLMHPLSFRQVLVSSDYQKYYFFPQCVVLRNSLPCHIVTIQDLDSFKAAVATIQH